MPQYQPLHGQHINHCIAGISTIAFPQYPPLRWCFTLFSLLLSCLGHRVRSTIAHRILHFQASRGQVCWVGYCYTNNNIQLLHHCKCHITPQNILGAPLRVSSCASSTWHHTTLVEINPGLTTAQTEVLTSGSMSSGSSLFRFCRRKNSFAKLPSLIVRIVTLS